MWISIALFMIYIYAIHNIYINHNIAINHKYRKIMNQYNEPDASSATTNNTETTQINRNKIYKQNEYDMYNAEYRMLYM